MDLFPRVSNDMHQISKIEHWIGDAMCKNLRRINEIITASVELLSHRQCKKFQNSRLFFSR